MVDIFGFPDDVFGEAFGGSAPGGQTYAQLVAGLGSAMWYKFNEPSGTTVVNYGSFGSNQNGTWTAGSGAVGQVGKLGAQEAYDFDGAASLIAIAQTSTNIGNMATYTDAFLVKADGLGESNTGTLIEVGTLGGIPVFGHTGAFGAMRANEWAGSVPNSASQITSISFAVTGSWVWYFRDFDNAGDRKNHIFKGINGGVTEATYGTDTAMAAARSALGTQVTIGNNSAAANSWDGLIDEWIRTPYIMSAAQKLALVQATGV